MWQCEAEQQRGIGAQAMWTGTALLQALEPGRFEAGKCLASKEQFDVNSEIVEEKGKKISHFSPHLSKPSLSCLHVSY